MILQVISRRSRASRSRHRRSYWLYALIALAGLGVALFFIAHAHH